MGCLAAMARAMAVVGASGASARVGEGCILLVEEVRLDRYSWRASYLRAWRCCPQEGLWEVRDGWKKLCARRIRKTCKAFI
jgi:hypothetical protein